MIVRHARPERDERGGLLGERVDHVVSSPLRRARETAAPLARALGVEVEVVDGLAEVDRHEARYVPAEELALDDAIVQTYLTTLVGHADPFVLQPDYCGIVRVQAASNGIRTVRSANETAHVRGLGAR